MTVCLYSQINVKGSQWVYKPLNLALDKYDLMFNVVNQNLSPGVPLGTK